MIYLIFTLLLLAYCTFCLISLVWQIRGPDSHEIRPRTWCIGCWIIRWLRR